MREWGYPPPDVLVTSVGSEIHWSTGVSVERDGEFAGKIAEGWDARQVDALADTLPFLSPQPGVDQRLFKRSYYVEDQRAAARVTVALENAGCRARVIYSHGRLLDILPASAGKGAALNHVLGVLGLKLTDAIVAGDSGNDRDMLRACPNAIIVANHEAALDDLGERSQRLCRVPALCRRRPRRDERLRPACPNALLEDAA